MASMGLLDTVLRIAVDATAAAAGWVLYPEGDQVTVVAAAGESAAPLVGLTTAADAGPAGFVLATGQPLALAPRPGDPLTATGVAAEAGWPLTSVVCVACPADDGVGAVLELVNKRGGGSFSFDDVELATLLAGIVAAALLEGPILAAVAPPDPLALGGDLVRLAQTDPLHYAAVASALSALLARG